MIKSAMTFVFLVVACLYIGDTTISTNPFAIKLQKPAAAIGCFLFCMGLALIVYSAHKEGYKDGLEKSIEQLNAAKEGGE